MPKPSPKLHPTKRTSTSRSASRPRVRLVLALVLSLAVLGLAPLRAAAAGLVIDGVQIADAATFDAAKKDGKLVLYSTYDTPAMKPVVARFESDTGLSVEVIRLPSQQMFERVVAEFSAHRLGADYVDTTDITLTDQLMQKGVFRGFKVNGFGAIEPVLRDGDGRWYQIIRSVMVIGVNTATMKPGDAPVKWNDLLDPKWKGKLGFASIDAGGTAYSLYFFLRQRYGIDFWKKLAAQDGRIGPSASPVATDLTRGETSVALDPISSVLAGAAGGAPVKVVIPSEGVPSFGISGGIAVTAPHPHAAELWMDWITSRRGSTALGEGAAYGILRDEATPVVPGVAMPSEDKIYNIRLADYTRQRDAFTKDWHQIFGH
jgi:iron(III) transport system substrate-binding protein